MNNETFRKITKHIALAAARFDLDRPKVDVSREYYQTQAVGAIPQIQIQNAKTFPNSQEIDFGKISKFISDSSVTLIECGGLGKKIKIKKGGTVIPSDETLTLGEIMSILNQFSRLAKVPITQMFKAKIGNLSINAFISPVSGTRFMIIKE